MGTEKLDMLLKDGCKLKEEIEELKAKQKDKNAELTKINMQIIEYFEENKLQHVKSKTHTVFTSDKRSVKILDRNTFYEWLKEKDIFDDTVTVSSASLGPIYDQEFEAARESGDMKFLKNGIPGLSLPSVYKTISYRKVKK